MPRRVLIVGGVAGGPRRPRDSGGSTRRRRSCSSTGASRVVRELRAALLRGQRHRDEGKLLVASRELFRSASTSSATEHEVPQSIAPTRPFACVISAQAPSGTSRTMCSCSSPGAAPIRPAAPGWNCRECSSCERFRTAAHPRWLDRRTAARQSWWAVASSASRWPRTSFIAGSGDGARETAAGHAPARSGDGRARWRHLRREGGTAQARGRLPRHRAPGGRLEVRTEWTRRWRRTWSSSRWASVRKPGCARRRAAVGHEEASSSMPDANADPHLRRRRRDRGARRRLGQETVLPLAGPANRQGRIAAEAIAGPAKPSAASRGRHRRRAGAHRGHHGRERKGPAPCGRDRLRRVYLHPGHHAGYYPGATPIHLKLLFSRKDGRILGAQAVGHEGVDKRIDVIATMIQMRGTVHDLAEAELCYAPQYGAAKDPVNVAGMMAVNVPQGRHAARGLVGARPDERRCSSMFGSRTSTHGDTSPARETCRSRSYAGRSRHPPWTRALRCTVRRASARTTPSGCSCSSASMPRICPGDSRRTR